MWSQSSCWHYFKDLENLEKIRKDSINDSENRIILWLKRFFSYFNSNQSRLWRIERTLWNSQQQNFYSMFIVPDGFQHFIRGWNSSFFWVETEVFKGKTARIARAWGWRQVFLLLPEMATVNRIYTFSLTLKIPFWKKSNK